MKKCIVIDRCSKCPYRKPDQDIAQGDGDICLKTRRNLDYRACMKKGEFPKGCPLPEYKERSYPRSVDLTRGYRVA